MKKNLFIILIALISLGTSLSAQQRYFGERGVFKMHNLYPVLLNPGAIGFENSHNLLLNYRNTWADFDGAPNTFSLSYDAPIADRLGFGAQVLRDNYGSLNTTKGLVGVSYYIPSDYNKISFGLTAEYIDHALSTGDDPVNEDPIIVNRLDGAQFFDVSFGIHGRYDNSFIYGIAFPSLVSAMISDVEDSEEFNDIGFIGQVGYEWDITGYDILLTPMITVKNLRHTPFHTDLNLTAKFLEDRLIGGLGYTIGGDKTLSFLVGTNIKDLTLLYSYNASGRDFQTYNDGSHEFTVGYKIGKTPMTKKTVKEEEVIFIEE